MGIFRRNRGRTEPAATREEVAPPPAPPASGEQELFADGQDDSDVFLCDEAKKTSAIGDVTLFVYGWHSVAPGPLSWAFPNVRAALDAVQRMKNAIGWSIVAGKGHASIDEARAKGAVLIEQLG